MRCARGRGGLSELGKISAALRFWTLSFPLLCSLADETRNPVRNIDADACASLVCAENSGLSKHFSSQARPNTAGEIQAPSCSLFSSHKKNKELKSKYIAVEVTASGAQSHFTGTPVDPVSAN